MHIHSYAEFREHPDDHVWWRDVPCDVHTLAQFRFSLWDLRLVQVEASGSTLDHALGLLGPSVSPSPDKD